MIDDEKFLERLRDDAQQLRYEADDAVLTRLAARVRERIGAQPSVAQVLAHWFRPIAVSLASLALVAILGVQWYERTHEPAATLEAAMSAEPVEVSLDGNTYTLNQQQ